MGRLIRRMLVIFLIHLAIYICFPYTAGDNVFILAISLIAWLGGIILFSFIFYIVGLSKSKTFNFLFDLFIVFVSLYILLNIYPQRDAVSPYQKVVVQKKYPTYEDAKYGLSKLGVDIPSKKTVQKDFKQTIEILPEIKENLSNHLDKDNANND
ncbi:MAG: hypothetical protein HN833_02050 [Elusimicrobiaceae bacterium]|jgi:hypothetical protein|nr:hypothetical protein [Elusimicrobiaceae bacterium]MBT3955409.1 hypothetical protein [Elusimicrobiaceae bacterium]MBT4007686.1 hypothetical protein [Elusimicrobiaceae bacterium]MBT4402304.1 hypothetical protein [Elusimicrobiaceae bacterium]MBT4439537.1 hypothetical protein [Elusimicrobiaceae bacterium]